MDYCPNDQILPAFVDTAEDADQCHERAARERAVKKRDIGIRADQSSAVVRRTLTALARGSRCLIVRLILPRLE